MKNKLVVLGSAINLVTLLVGIALGFIGGSYKTNRVYAQVVSGSAVEEIAPGISAGSAAFATLLAGREAVDQIAVSGLDLMKLHQNTLNLLGSKPLVFSQMEIQAVIDHSRADTILRMKQPANPKGTK